MEKFLELGTPIYCYNAILGKQACIVKGFIQGIEIAGSGRICYKVGIKEGTISCNPCAVAITRDEATDRLSEFIQLLKRNDEEMNIFYGKSQFNFSELQKSLNEPGEIDKIPGSITPIDAKEVK